MHFTFESFTRSLVWRSQETLRFHPIVPGLLRIAAYDDVIPLTDPITTSTGAKLTEIPVEKGQLVEIAIAYYNRSV